MYEARVWGLGPRVFECSGVGCGSRYRMVFRLVLPRLGRRDNGSGPIGWDPSPLWSKSVQRAAVSL